MPADVQNSHVLSWSAYEHDHIERGNDWFWALGITTACIAIISLLVADFFFAIVIIVAAFTIALLARTPPTLAQFTISERGVRVNSVLHRYDEVVSFWIDEDHKGGRPLLLVDTTKFMAPNLIIPLEGIEPSSVRAYLKQHTDEVPMREPISHRVFEFLGL